MYSRIFSVFHLALRAARILNASQCGQMGMELALVGVVCATCVFGGVIIATSEEAAQQLDSVFDAGLARASGTLIVSGSVLATASGDPPAVDAIVITLGTIGEPAPVDLDPTSTDGRLVLAFATGSGFDNDIPYSATELRGDGDGLLEPGETAEVRLNIFDVGGGTLTVGPLEEWTLRIAAPSGGDLEVSRTMPLALEPVNSLR